MASLMCIDAIKPKMKGWSAEVTVQEKTHPNKARESPVRYQKVILADSEGSRVEGIMFDDAVDKMGPKLQIYKKYRISNAEVRPIKEKYRIGGIAIQWVISTRTVVQELDDAETNIISSHFDFIRFKDLAPYADSKTQTVDIIGVVIDVMPVVPIKRNFQESYVQKFLIINEEMIPTVLSLWNEFIEKEGKLIAEKQKNYPVVACRRLKVVIYNGIALSTRNDSIVLVDPPMRDARILKNWATRNEKCLVGVSEQRTYANQSPETFYGSKQKITSIADVIATKKPTWVKCALSFEHVLQRYWYMACVKCHRLTSASYGCEYTCNHCNELQTAQPRCRFDVDLTDDTDTLTASIFGELAEGLLGYSALDAMEASNKSEDLPLAAVHEGLKPKTFIVQLKPGNIRDDGSYQRYTIVYYFEEASNQQLVHNDNKSSAESVGVHADSQAALAQTPDKKCSSSTVRICLDSKFEESQQALDNASMDDQLSSVKKQKPN